ncbi:hypothetical protein AYI69_g11360 [Smittium culicis]|uniref:Uncharacterized protein n=1 Tax=Smittium culicis TaxID=133412 RepID=A0A1R1WZ86_9FUNG|nr:hypothetical protein AYI69_g11360 [Smittium culicis]
MPPRYRHFFPDTIPDPAQENSTQMDQPQHKFPEAIITPEQEYIDTQIRNQVQAQIQAYIQIKSQVQPVAPTLHQNTLQPTTSSLTSKIKLPDAAKFDGKVSEYTSFMANMNLFFWGSPETFTLDRDKIIFVGTHLLDTAST